MVSGAAENSDEEEGGNALVTQLSDMTELFPLMADIVACPAVPARGTLHALHQLVRSEAALPAHGLPSASESTCRGCTLWVLSSLHGTFCSI